MCFFSSKSLEEFAHFFCKQCTYLSAKHCTSTTHKESTSESVKQNTLDAQKESNSVTQKDRNFDTDVLDLADKIENSQTFLKRNPNPEYKPAKRFKTKHSEAELKARAEKANMFKDTRTYNYRQHVFFLGLFDNLDNSLLFSPFIFLIIKLIHHVKT